MESGFNASDETCDVHVNCLCGVHSLGCFYASGRNVRCACPVAFVERWLCLLLLPLGVETQPLHTPSPSSLPSAAMRTSEEEGLHLRPSSSHCGCSVSYVLLLHVVTAVSQLKYQMGSTVEQSHVYYRPIFVGTLCTFCQRRNVVHGWDVNGPLTDRSPYKVCALRR